MRLPFVLRIDPKPRIQQVAAYLGRPVAYACRGRGVHAFGASPEMAWALWFNDAFEGSPHGLTVLRLAEESDRRRITRDPPPQVEGHRVLDGVHLAIPGDHP